MIDGGTADATKTGEPSPPTPRRKSTSHTECRAGSRHGNNHAMRKKTNASALLSTPAKNVGGAQLTNDLVDHVELPGAGESIAWKSQTPWVIRKRVMRLCVVSLTSLRWCFTTSRRDRPGSSTALGPFSGLVSRGRRRTICQLFQRFKIAQ